MVIHSLWEMSVGADCGKRRVGQLSKNGEISVQIGKCRNCVKHYKLLCSSTTITQPFNSSYIKSPVSQLEYHSNQMNYIQNPHAYY